MKNKLLQMILVSVLSVGAFHETKAQDNPETNTAVTTENSIAANPVVPTTPSVYPNLNTYVKLDYVNSSLKFNDSYQTPSSKSNVLLALGLDYKFNPYISAYGELAIAGLGGEDIKITTGKSDLHFATFLLPVGAKFYPIPELAFSAGFNLGFIINALGKENGKRIKYDNFSSGNHSFSLGIEGYFSKKFFAEAKYNIGLSDIKTTDQQKVVINNNFLQIGLGYKIDTWYYNK